LPEIDEASAEVTEEAMEAEGSVEATEETTETGVLDTRAGEAMEAAMATTREEVAVDTETIREAVDTEAADMGEGSEEVMGARGSKGSVGEADWVRWRDEDRGHRRSEAEQVALEAGPTGEEIGPSNDSNRLRQNADELKIKMSHGIVNYED